MIKQHKCKPKQMQTQADANPSKCKPKQMQTLRRAQPSFKTRSLDMFGSSLGEAWRLQTFELLKKLLANDAPAGPLPPQCLWEKRVFRKKTRPTTAQRHFRWTVLSQWGLLCLGRVTTTRTSGFCFGDPLLNRFDVGVYVRPCWRSVSKKMRQGQGQNHLFAGVGCVATATPTLPHVATRDMMATKVRKPTTARTHHRHPVSSCLPASLRRLTTSSGRLGIKS